MLSRRRLNVRRFSGFCVCFTDLLCIPLVDRDDTHAVAVGEFRDGSADCERRDEEWTKKAVASGFESALSVPLAVDDRSHGVLAVYASEPEAFSELERTVLAELGTNVANSIEVVTTRRTLHADTVAELSLQFDGTDTFLAQVASETGDA